ncbi:MAG TPA: recombinase B [Cyanobacteria bacterium UBA8803]|nr:recombinase B [Cyanobacteria bacterium UBA8803]
MLVTDDLLLHYKRCRRRAFLDVYGDSTQQDPPADFLLKLQQDSFTHKQTVLGIDHQNQAVNRQAVNRQALESPLLSALPFSADITNPRLPHYPRENWEAGAKATLELMQQGTNCIAQPVLLMQTPEGVTLVSYPDLLIKQPGQSNLGEWLYVPITIKFGRRPKAEYQMVAAFRAQLLAAMQGVLPSSTWLILRRQGAYAVNLERWVPLMQEVLSECIETIQQRQEPEVFISRQKCSLCQWYSSCHAIAKSQKHISLLPGVTPSRYQILQELEITAVESLAQANVSILESAFGVEVASDLVQQARATVENRAILRQKPNSSPNQPSREGDGSENADGLSLAAESGNGKRSQSIRYTDTLPAASVELFFDIEAEPELKLDYLLGLLVIDRSTDTETFHPLVAENPQDEASIWQEFLDLVWLYPDAPIFHFSDYEVETVKRLAKLYHTPLWRLQPLLSRFVDVHHRVMSSVMLPVESYSLKHLARWLGFEWRDAEITGSQCVCLYNRWLATGDRSLLNTIQRYNEDDCRATYHLKNWLFNFLQENSP